MDSVKATKASDFEFIFDATYREVCPITPELFFEDRPWNSAAAAAVVDVYDKMVGKFTGNDLPACGFSIGFERISSCCFLERIKVPTSPKPGSIPRSEKGVSGERLCEVITGPGSLAGTW